MSAAARTSTSSSRVIRSTVPFQRSATRERPEASARSARTRTGPDSWRSSSGVMRCGLSIASSISMAYSTDVSSGFDSSSTSVSTVAASAAGVMTASGVIAWVSMLSRNERRYSWRARMATATQSPVMASVA